LPQCSIFAVESLGHSPIWLKCDNLFVRPLWR
jgi:hypothetical protein